MFCCDQDSPLCGSWRAEVRRCCPDSCCAKSNAHGAPSTSASDHCAQNLRLVLDWMGNPAKDCLSPHVEKVLDNPLEKTQPQDSVRQTPQMRVGNCYQVFCVTM
jgi:hypothetical protein